MLLSIPRLVPWTLWFSAIALALPLCIFNDRSSAANDIQTDLRFHLQTSVLGIEGKQDRPYVLLNEMSSDQKLGASDHDPSMQSDYISVYSQTEKSEPADQSSRPLARYCYRSHPSHKTHGNGTSTRRSRKRSWMMPYLLALYVVAGLVTLVVIQAILLHMVELVMRVFGYPID